MKLINISDASDPRLELYRNVRERDMVSRDGYFMAEGKVVLSQLLSSRSFEPASVLILEARLPGLLHILAEAETNLEVYVVNSIIMDKISGFPMHRGVLAIGKRRGSTEQGLPSFGDDALVVILAGLSNHDNVGAAFRNAAAFEADAVILDEQCCDPLYRKAIRVSVGAVLRVPYYKGGSLFSIANQLLIAGFSIAALSPSGTNNVVDLPKSGRRALILGSEGTGLPKDVLEKFSTWAIPMSATFDSLNVATASGIALFHSSRFDTKPKTSRS